MIFTNSYILEIKVNKLGDNIILTVVYALFAVVFIIIGVFGFTGGARLTAFIGAGIVCILSIISLLHVLHDSRNHE